MKNTHHTEGKLEPKWLGSYTIAEVKESSGYTVEDKYPKIKEKVCMILFYFIFVFCFLHFHCFM